MFAARFTECSVSQFQASPLARRRCHDELRRPSSDRHSSVGDRDPCDRARHRFIATVADAGRSAVTGSSGDYESTRRRSRGARRGRRDVPHVLCRVPWRRRPWRHTRTGPDVRQLGPWRIRRGNLHHDLARGHRHRHATGRPRRPGDLGRRGLRAKSQPVLGSTGCWRSCRRRAAVLGRRRVLAVPHDRRPRRTAWPGAFAHRRGAHCRRAHGSHPNACRTPREGL
jgi:hypothetical protein